MRIGHYAPDIWASGGVSTYIRRLGAAQADRGDSVVYLNGAPPTGGDPRPADGAPPSRAVHDTADLLRTATALSLDVLHLHRSVPGLRAATAPVPVVQTVHDNRASCPSTTRFLARSGRPCNRVPSLGGCLWGHVVDRCGSMRPGSMQENARRLKREVEATEQVLTLPVSNYLRARMLDAGCPPDTLHTLHSPAPVVDRPPGPVERSGPPRFLFLGRLVPEKGILWLLRAFAKAPASARLDVAGDGPLLERARAMARASGIAGRVAFHGWVPPEGVPALLARARAVVFPSLWHEPAGLVSLEAGAHGRALVASSVGGIPEYAVAGHALLVPPNDTGALAGALATLAGDAERADRMGAAGRRAATNRFSMGAFLDRLDAVYRSLRPAEAPDAPAAAPAG
jgi:glycosyltransferase involved in cell wall biosynthesis